MSVVLSVFIELQGSRVLVGKIVGNSDTAQFSYSQEYLTDKTRRAISLSMPLQEESFSAEQTKCFFEGLLPEGFSRRAVAQWLHVDETDWLSILHGLGRECIGAIQIFSNSDEIPSDDYEELSENQVKELAREGASTSTELLVSTHLSLAGATGKDGLYYDEKSQKWFKPVGLAPSTHIVKQSHVRLEGIVVNERLCLLTAELLGISVPESSILHFNDLSSDEFLFATKRYDRIFGEKPKTLCGHAVPCRLHQEDFCQALGIPAAKKYESDGDFHLKRMFALLRAYSADPISDQLKLWDMLIFNYLIGNTDAHIKNFSLLYSPDMKSIRLAPAYDLLSTIIYKSSTRDMAFSLSGERNISHITRDSFRAAAKEAGLGEKLAMSHFDDIKNRFSGALKQATEILCEQGITQAKNMCARILNAK